MEESKILKAILVPKAEFAIQVTLNGKIIDDRLLQPSHSWVRNVWILQCRNLGNTTFGDSTYNEGYFAYKQISGTITAGGAIAGTSLNDATLNEETEIVIGTGTDAESVLGYALTTLINSGTATGQMVYTASENMVQSWVGGVISCSRSRFFNNNSGDSITVNEIGIYTNAAVSNYMICRDKLTSGVVVPDTGQLKVTYVMSMDVSP